MKKKFKTFRTKKVNCFICGNTLDAATGKAKPEPGDITICFYCGTLYRFDENLILQLASNEILDPEEKILINKMRLEAKLYHSQKS